MMLRYSLGKEEQALRIEKAVQQVLAKGYRTADIYTLGTQKVGTVEMGQAVLSALV
jgi:3-isopropylmalate dehydrogenase